MIDTKSLMLGDWVRCNCEDPFNGKVVQITEKGVDVLDDIFVYTFDQIEPIPITPEILEKNGFTMSNCKGPKSWQLISSEMYCSWKTNRLNIRYGAERPMQEVHLKCYYVHELQHFLRMVGVEKEIEL